VALPAVGDARRARMGDTWRRDNGRTFGARSGRRRRATPPICAPPGNGAFRAEALRSDRMSSVGPSKTACNGGPQAFRTFGRPETGERIRNSCDVAAELDARALALPREDGPPARFGRLVSRLSLGVSQPGSSSRPLHLLPSVPRSDVRMASCTSSSPLRIPSSTWVRHAGGVNRYVLEPFYDTVGSGDGF
jgi:hypothetical protein